MQGSVVLIGGDPGIGKSTLLLQTAESLARGNEQGKNQVIYISGEESVDQIRLRANRTGVKEDSIQLAATTNVSEIINSIDGKKLPTIVIVDSIQTMFLEELSSAPGTVSQVRAAAGELTIFAKKNNITLLIVSHVTKDGQIAGPKVLEHMVDTVLYFEGEKDLHFRILRSIKNRFGAANEIGVFEMNEIGLSEVTNPSELFLTSYDRETSGSIVFAGVEGTRPILVEIQALVSPSFMPTPRRAVVGWDVNRLAMVIAVLSARFGLNLFDKEVYLNIVGGLKIEETAADLACACALISAARDIALPSQTIAIGEIGLSGEVRMVSNLEGRLKEAAKLGFKNCVATDISVTPPPEPHKELVPLLPQHKAGAFDPVSALLMLTRADGRPPCERRVEIFDGKQRYDIVLSFKHKIKLDDVEGGGAGETADVCRAMYVPVAGHRDNAATKTYASNSNVEVVMRRVPGTTAHIPYSVTVPTAWGTGSMVTERIELTMAGGTKVAFGR